MMGVPVDDGSDLKADCCFPSLVNFGQSLTAEVDFRMSILDIKFSEILQAIYSNESPGLTEYLESTSYVHDLAHSSPMGMDSTGSISDESCSRGSEVPQLHRVAENLRDMSADLAESSQKRKIRNKERKICRVCGDRALGYNFDAITCESCKAFFRRNALKSKPPVCMFTKDCKIDINTRRFCSACRLWKCMDVGMKKDMILDDSERQKRTMKVKMNRERRQVTVPVKTEQPDSPPNSCVASSSTAPHLHYSPPQLAMAFPWNDPMDADACHRKLTPEENNLIQQFERLYMTTVGSTEDDMHPPDMKEAITLNVLINSMGTVVRRLIRFAKKIDDFSALKQIDQISILKGITLTCLFIRSAQLYSSERDAWITPRGEVPTTILHKAVENVDFTLHSDHIQVIKALRQLIKENLTTISLLQIICLFNPVFATVGAKAHISNLQDRYSALLKHYLEATYGYAEAFRMHASLILKLSEIRQLSENHGKVLLSCDPEQIEPLLLEIFDLNDIRQASMHHQNTMKSSPGNV